MFHDMILSIAAKAAEAETKKSPKSDRRSAGRSKLDARADAFLASNGYDAEGQALSDG